MPPPHITYFEYVNSKLAEQDNLSLSVFDFIKKDKLAQFYWLNYKAVQENIDLYNKQAQGIENRQKYIDSLWWWTWIHKIKPRDDAENILFINKTVEEDNEFFIDNDDNANTLFGIYASSYATIMFVEKILLENYSNIFTLSTPAAFVIVGIALFNLLLDKYLFDYFWQGSSLDDRENFKLIMIILVAIVCITLEAYVIPVALLLYTAGYFMNYMLQKGNISKVINKTFYTQDEDGVPRLFEGFAQEQNIKFNNYHYALLFLGAFALSASYGTAMAALAAMWIYPTIAGFATLALGIGFTTSPLGLLICIPLIAYGIFYALFTAQAWARLVALYANFSQDDQYKNYSFGKFLIFAFALLFKNFFKGISKYFDDLSNITKEWENKSALQILGSIAWGLLTLTWKLVQISFSILTFYGMYYMLDQACLTIGKFIEHPQTGEVLTPISYMAQGPVMLQQSYYVANPETVEEKIKALPWTSEMRISFYRILNAMRVAFVPIGGEQASSSTERLAVLSNGGASFVLVNSAVKNARKELPMIPYHNVKNLTF